MASTFKWAKTYGRKGVVGLDNITIEILTAIQRKYSVDYLTVINELSKSYPPSSLIGSDLAETKKKIQLAVMLVGRVAGTAGRKATQAELKALFETISEVNERIRGLRDLTEQDAELKAYLKEISTDTRITAKHLEETQGVIQKSLKQAGPGKIGRLGGHLAPMVKGALAGAGKRFLYGLIGYGGASVLGAAGGSFSRIWGSKAKSQKRRVQLEPKIFQANDPSEMEDTSFDSLRAAPTISNFSAIAAPSTLPFSASRERTLGKKEQHNAALPLFYFFDKLAFRARWTKGLLSAVAPGVGMPKAGILGANGAVALGSSIGGGRSSLGGRYTDMIAGVGLAKFIGASPMLKTTIVGALVAASVLVWNEVRKQWKEHGPAIMKDIAETSWIDFTVRMLDPAPLFRALGFDVEDTESAFAHDQAFGYHVNPQRIPERITPVEEQISMEEVQQRLSGNPDVAVFREMVNKLDEIEQNTREGKKISNYGIQAPGVTSNYRLGGEQIRQSNEGYMNQFVQDGGIGPGE